MTRHAFFFSAFCLAVVAAFAVSLAGSYSPFANGGTRVFTHGFYGPTHK